MPRVTWGFEVNDLTQYRPAPTLADGSAVTGLDVSRYNAPSAVSGLLDFGASGAKAARLHAVVKYRNAPLLTWRYSQDGAAWTEASSGVLSGSVTDAALPTHRCQYHNETPVTTLANGGISARYWQVSIQDSDVLTGASWECGGYGRSSTSAGLTELWAVDANGHRLVEPGLLTLATETAQRGDLVVTTGDRIKVTAAGEGG